MIIIRSVLNTICLPNCVVIFLPYIISGIDNYTTSTALPTLCSRFATLRSLSPRTTLATNHHIAITHTRAHQPPCCNTPPMFPSTTHPYTHNTPFPFGNQVPPLFALTARSHWSTKSSSSTAGGSGVTRASTLSAHNRTCRRVSLVCRAYQVAAAFAACVCVRRNEQALQTRAA